METTIWGLGLRDSGHAPVSCDGEAREELFSVLSREEGNITRIQSP